MVFSSMTITEAFLPYSIRIDKMFQKEKLKISTGLEHFVALEVFLINVPLDDWMLLSLLCLTSQLQRLESSC